MKSTFYLLIALLFATSAWAQNNNRGRSRPNYNPTNLTDAQRKEADTFVHQGREQRIALEACATEAGSGLTAEESKLFQTDPAKAYQQFGDKLDKAQDLCGGKEEVKGLGLSPEMAGAITKAYAAIIGLGGDAFGKMKLKSLDDVAKDKQATEATEATETAETTDAGKADEASEKDERDDTDYCKWVAVGTEAIAMVQQTMAQQEMQSVPLAQENSAQRAAILRVKRGYEERRKNAQTQFIGWGVTAGCYTAMMFRPAVSKKAWQNWVKVGASAFLTTVFGLQVKGFKEAAEKTGRVADALKTGDNCNPHTERDCYCSEPTTMHHPQYCAPYLHQRSIRDPGITMRTSCIDNRAQADPNCDCLINDACLHTGMDTLFSLDGLGGEVNPAFLSDLKALSTGTLPGSLNAPANTRTANAARTAMKKADEELAKLAPPNPILTKEQEKEAKFLESQGVPSTLARAMASTPVDGDMKAALAATQSRFKGVSVAAKPASDFKASLKDSASGGGLRPKKAKKVEDKANPFAKFMNQNKKGPAQPTGNVLHLAQKAQDSAQISNRKESSVFDIISHRYKTSAWRRLELEDL